MTITREDFKDLDFRDSNNFPQIERLVLGLISERDELLKNLEHYEKLDAAIKQAAGSQSLSGIEHTGGEVYLLQKLEEERRWKEAHRNLNLRFVESGLRELGNFNVGEEAIKIVEDQARRIFDEMGKGK